MQTVGTDSRPDRLSLSLAPLCLAVEFCRLIPTVAHPVAPRSGGMSHQLVGNNLPIASRVQGMMMNISHCIHQYARAASALERALSSSASVFAR